MKRILYLHAGAEMYGADKVLLELIKGLDSKEFEAHVILPNDGVLVEALRQVGAQVSVLDYPILRRKYFFHTHPLLGDGFRPDSYLPLKHSKTAVTHLGWSYE